MGGHEIGTLINASGVEHHLVVAGGDRPGACAWALLEGGERPAMAFYLTRETFEALRDGDTAEDGAASVGGQVFWLRAGWDGVAELVRGDCPTDARA